MSGLKRKVMDWFYSSRFYPHIYLSANPFKIYEFHELMKRTHFHDGDIALDIGCGAGLQTNLIGKKCSIVVGVDVSPGALGRAISEQSRVAGRINSEFKLGTIEELKFPDAYFDKIFSVCVIEHIPDYASALRECYRILKPGGQLIFSADSLATIHDPELKRMHTEKFFVRHYFDPQRFSKELSELGFKNIRLAPIFRSTFAAKLFSKGIREDFRFRYLQAIVLYWKLAWHEFFCLNRGKGIFLVIDCSK